MTLDVTVQTEYQWRALSYLQELFSDMKKIGVRPCPLLQLLQEKDRSRFPRNNLNKSQKREIYNFWLKKVHSIQSVDCRPGPYKVKLS